jgi:hypothetical protein
METGSLLHNGSVLHGKFKQKSSDTGSSTSYLDHACAFMEHAHLSYPQILLQMPLTHCVKFKPKSTPNPNFRSLLVLGGALNF